MPRKRPLFRSHAFDPEEELARISFQDQDPFNQPAGDFMKEQIEAWTLNSLQLKSIGSIARKVNLSQKKSRSSQKRPMESSSENITISAANKDLRIRNDRLRAANIERSKEMLLCWRSQVVSSKESRRESLQNYAPTVAVVTPTLAFKRATSKSLVPLRHRRHQNAVNFIVRVKEPANIDNHRESDKKHKEKKAQSSSVLRQLFPLDQESEKIKSKMSKFLIDKAKPSSRG